MVVEINTSEVKTANSINNTIDIFLKKDLLPNLEKLLQKYDIPNTVIRFQKLKINLNVEDWENPEKIKFEILWQFEEQLQKKIKGEGAINELTEMISSQSEEELQNLTVVKNDEEIFLYFLKNGFLPWYGKKQQIEAFRKKKSWHNSFANTQFIGRLKNLLSKNETVFARFFYQFPNEMLVAFLTKINDRLAETNTLVVDTLNKLQSGLDLEFLHTLFLISVETKNDRLISVIQRWLKILKQNKKALRNKGDGLISSIGQLILRGTPDDLISEEKFQKILNKSLFLISYNRFPKDDYAVLYEDREKLETMLSERIMGDEKKEQDFFGNDFIEIAVHNAGLVLLHPFLKYFFTVVRITNKLGNIIPTKCELAVQTLHYLATGSEEFFEGNLVLEKFLCGLSLNMPIPRKSRLTEEIKKEAEIMLAEVIKNWPALKNTSPEGLRQMFLQRDGKLIQNDKNFRLIIERKTQDILLEKLNWNISLIKLSWKNELLFVDW